jgi:hypothetical protein
MFFEVIPYGQHHPRLNEILLLILAPTLPEDPEYFSKPYMLSGIFPTVLIYWGR